jgi:hypothetical protein
MQGPARCAAICRPMCITTYFASGYTKGFICRKTTGCTGACLPSDSVFSSTHPWSRFITVRCRFDCRPSGSIRQIQCCHQLPADRRRAESLMNYLGRPYGSRGEGRPILHESAHVRKCDSFVRFQPGLIRLQQPEFGRPATGYHAMGNTAWPIVAQIIEWTAISHGDKRASVGRCVEATKSKPPKLENETKKWPSVYRPSIILSPASSLAMSDTRAAGHLVSISTRFRMARSVFAISRSPAGEHGSSNQARRFVFTTRMTGSSAVKQRAKPSISETICLRGSHASML